MHNKINQKMSRLLFEEKVLTAFGGILQISIILRRNTH